MMPLPIQRRFEMSRIRPRAFAMLAFAALAGIVGMTTTQEATAARRTSPVSSKLCYYGSGIYSLGACVNGKECVRGVNDEDYWQTTNSCDQTSPGSGGMRQI